MARWPIKKKKKSGSPRTDAAPHTERPVPAPEADESALETYLPERGEVFFEEEPKPFAVSLREILQEYRSDSSPSRYAMAVELGEADDWEEYLGPPTEEPEPIYPADERAVQDMLHASWKDSHADEPEISLYPGPGSHLRGIDSAPYAEPASSAAEGGYRAGSGPQLRDILSEYRDGPAEETAPADRGHAPMTSMDAQPDTRPAAALTEPEDELPAGIRTLQDRRAEDFSTPRSAHLTVEDILSEFRGYTAPEPQPEEASPVLPADSVPAEERHPGKSRRASMEDEARRLFSGVRRAVKEAPAAPIEEAHEEIPVPAAEPEEPTAAPEAQRPEADAFAFDIPEDTEVPAADEAGENAAPAGEAEKKPLAALKGRLSGLAARRKKMKDVPASASPAPVRETAEGLDDSEVSPAAYAVDDEYEAEETDSNAFPSFGQYLAGLFSGLLIRVRGLGTPHSGETMEADEEDLGEEVKPAAASRYYGAHVQSLRLRFRIALILWLVLAYISLGVPATGMLRTIEVAAGMCLGLQLGILLLSLDVVTNAAVNLTRGRFGADSLAVLSCLLTSVDALAVMLQGFGSPHVPLCLISSFSLLGVLFASLLSARGLRKSLRVPAIGKKAYSVTAESELTERTITLIKSDRPVSGFVRRSEEAAPDEVAYNRAAPLLLLLGFVMSLIVALAKKSPSDFLFILTAILAPAVPFTALLSYALPFFIGSERIFPSGAAIAGWSGLCDVGGSHNLIVTDRDLFPENCVDIDTIRIFADMPSEKVIAYAGSMIAASGSGLSPCFAALMERNNCSMRQVEDFEYLPGGGLRGTIDGQSILCGGTELMRLMNVRIPFRLVGKTSVLLAIDGVLYGIFNMKYEPSPTVRKALVGLIRSNRHPVFAIRDFNVNPEMLHETFDVATDGYDFPPYVERFAISDAKPSENRKIAAVLCREGLGPLVHMADTGRSIYLSVRINLMISLLASVIGVFAVFFQLLTAGTISMAALFLYALIWLIPAALVSLIRF